MSFFSLLIKPWGFSDNKQALLVYYVLSRGARGYSNKPPLKPNTELRVCLPALMLCYLVPRAHGERGSSTGWIFIWDRHLRLASFLSSTSSFFTGDEMDAGYWRRCVSEELTTVDTSIIHSRVPYRLSFERCRDVFDNGEARLFVKVAWQG